MMKKIVRAAAVAVLAGTLLTAHATAAQAAYRLAGNYGWPDQCSYYGQAGVANHNWTQWYCQTVTPANMALGYPGNYNLWVQ
ncbi:hypothetical protein [Hamadaea tsunoensis]|uniref:hypothetical protein n=1 Tax=Hamadaea tsunoensis TaxID=53368 RepID=UPI00048A3EFB|nr:hypothetical protein [Hamadaea tsunoensis]